MSNPIDKIYSDGLNDRHYEFQEADWLQAKRMLELRERKHPIPIWFWIGVGIISLVGMAHVYYNPNPIDNAEIELLAAKANDSDKTFTIDKIDKTPLKTEPVVTSSDSDENSKSITTGQSKYDSNLAIANMPSEEQVNLSSNLLTTKESFSLISTGSSNYENTPVPRGKMFSNFRNTLQHSSPTSKETTSNIADEGSEASGSDEETTSSSSQSRDQLINEASKTLEGKSLLTINALPLLLINPLTYQLEFPKMENKKLETVMDCCSSIPLSLSAYTAFTSPVPNWSAGLQVTYRIKNNWYLASGIGINWNLSYKISSDITNPDIQNMNSNFASSTLNEQIEIKRMGIEVPVLLIHQRGKHEVFVGGLFNRSIWVQRNNTSRLGNDLEIVDPGNGGIDLADPQVPNPVILAQESTSTQDPELLRWDTYLSAGYGYEIGQHLGIRLQGNYKITSDTFIQSTITDNMYELDVPKWSGRVSVLWHF